MDSKLFRLILLFFLFVVMNYVNYGFCVDVPTGKTEETERPYDLRPYRIGIFLSRTAAFAEQTKERDDFKRTLQNRLSTLVGNYWQTEIEFVDPGFELALNDLSKGIPENWEQYDKIFFVSFESQSPERLSGFAAVSKFRIRSFDVITRFSGSERRYAVENPSKTLDLLVQSFFDQFLPIAKLENASQHSASLRIRGNDLLDPNIVALASKPNSSKPIFFPENLLIPFVRSLDSNGKVLAVSRIDWTVLAAETIDPQTGLLQCRIESGLRDPLGKRRRGRTEIYAISVPAPMQATTIRLQIRAGEHSNLLPRCDVFETIPGEEKPLLIGQSNLDGSFPLEPIPGRPLRLCSFRSGRMLIAQLPVVRGLDRELLVPISDDSIRLEAEAAIIRIQEEIVDVKARRSILRKRLEKAQKDGKDKLIRDTRSELSLLKDDERFLLELKQAQLRFRSDDPLVQRRIDRMFRITEQTVKQYGKEKTLMTEPQQDETTQPE